jgi:hypothetical protein
MPIDQSDAVNATDDLVSRCLQLLQGAIRASGQTQTEVDERIGRRKGYLSHVFQRRVDLKVIDLLLALEVLDIDPRRFFLAVTQSTKGSSGVLELLAGRLEEEQQQAKAPARAAAGDAVLEERVRRTLRSILLKLGEQTRFSRA